MKGLAVGTRGEVMATGGACGLELELKQQQFNAAMELYSYGGAGTANR